MLSKKLQWWKSEPDDWLSEKVDKWFTQGYSRLHSKKLSRSCQTMLDHPQQQKSLLWNHTDVQLLEDESQQYRRQQINMQDEKADNEEKEENLQCPAVSNEISLDTLLDNKEIEEYLDYLNKPIIAMNDNYIEIHQYHYEPEMVKNMLPQLREEYRPPSRRKHYINETRTEIVETKGFCPVSTEYSEFLIRRNQEHTHSIKIINTPHVYDNETKDYNNQDRHADFDNHRKLTQVVQEKQEEVNDQDDEMKVNGRQMFTRKGNKNDENCSFRSFSSLRGSKKNKSGRRKKKILVGENGLNGPIWPGVLLTFDRAVSPTSDKNNNEEPNESVI